MFDSERAFTYTIHVGRELYKNKIYKIMSQSQYLKIIEKEMQRINKIIDLKILNGENYSKEARDHKLLLKKIRYVNRNRSSLFSRFFNINFSFN